MRLTYKLGRLALIVIIAISWSGCFAQRNGNGKQGELAEYEKTFFVMDTFVTVQFFADSPGKAQAIFSDVEGEMNRLEGILSSHLPNSDISRISEAAGINPVKVSPETIAVLKTAIDYAARTEGSFDVTLAPVLRLYSFVPGEEKRPSRQQLERNLPLVDWRRLEINDVQGTVFLKDAEMRLDLGGIAKGYITDRATAIVVEHDIEFGLINAGGDIRFLGPKRDGSAWRVGIKDPNNPDTHNFAIIEVEQGSIVTSGDYERFFIEDGVRYHHLIDPQNGLPADGVRSVTVLAPTAEQADLLSTAVFIMGSKAGLNLVNSMAEVEVLIWTADGEVLWSSGLKLVPEQPIDYYFRLSN